MAGWNESVDDMMARMWEEEMRFLNKMGVQMTVYCPYDPPTRWDRFKNDVLAFIGWR